MRIGGVLVGVLGVARAVGVLGVVGVVGGILVAAIWASRDQTVGAYASIDHRPVTVAARSRPPVVGH